jgi:hypothetical protein
METVRPARRLFPLAIPCLALAALLCALPACALRSRSTVADGAAAPAMSELWTQAEAGRDLFGGPGGTADAPDPQGEFTFIKKDVTGKSPGYDVKDAQGRFWSVKLGPEAQSEVVVSRLLWGAGYYQPATYYLPAWTLVGSATDAGVQPAGRFRLESAGEENVGAWAWGANPFVGTTQLRGLFVLMVMVNNWDLKTQQNKMYELSAPGATPLRRYVVRDLGAALGSTRWFFPGSKSNLEDFERERFIHSVSDGRVRFYYHGAWREPHLKRGVTPADVRWIAERLAQLTAGQWSDAFKAAGYNDADAQRFVLRLRQKVDEGLMVGG